MKDAWVLRLKPEIAKEHHEGKTLYLTDETFDFLTENLQEAEVFFDKEGAEKLFKDHEKFMFERFGSDAICNFGYSNISKNFDWVPVEVEECK